MQHKQASGLPEPMTFLLLVYQPNRVIYLSIRLSLATAYLLSRYLTVYLPRFVSLSVTTTCLAVSTYTGSPSLYLSIFAGMARRRIFSSFLLPFSTAEQ